MTQHMGILSGFSRVRSLAAGTEEFIFALGWQSHLQGCTCRGRAAAAHVRPGLIILRIAVNTQRRPGSIAVLVAVLMAALVAVSAISVDMSRMLSLRNELQFSADAGAHAGAIQLIEPNDQSFTIDTAAAYAVRYLAMQGVVRVDSVELGGWDDMTRLFIPGLTPFNAVRVVVSRRAPGLLVSHFGVNSPRIRARAVGWVQHDSTAQIRRVMLTQ